MYKVDRKHVNLSDPLFIQNLREETEEEAEDADLINTDKTRIIPNLREELAAATASVNDELDKAKSLLERASAESRNIVTEAETKAENIIASSYERVEAELELARKKGYEAGLEEGKQTFDEKLIKQRAEDEKILAAKMQEDDEALRCVVDRLNSESLLAYEELEQEAITLSLDIVKKIVNPDGFEGTAIFESLIRNALRQLNPSGKVVIRVGAVEYERFFPSGGTVFSMDNGAKISATVLRDVSLNGGDLIIDSDEETVNAGVETQIKSIRFAFDRVRLDDN